MNHYSSNIRFLLKNRQGSEPGGLSDQYASHPTPDDLVTLAAAFNLSIDTLISRDLQKTSAFDLSKIRFLVLDVDGALTDGGMYYTESGDEFKKFNTKDGMGIKNIVKSGLPVGIISSGINVNLVRRRAELLGINYVFVGKGDKLPVLESWCKELDIDCKQVAYIGDDINDIPVMKKVGFSACPADAIDEVKAIVSVVLRKKGGEGCVREFLDTYMHSSSYAS